MKDKPRAGQEPENNKGKSTWLRRTLKDSLSVAGDMNRSMTAGYSMKSRLSRCSGG